jgi:hypothetical protein
MFDFARLLTWSKVNIASCLLRLVDVAREGFCKGVLFKDTASCYDHAAVILEG